MSVTLLQIGILACVTQADAARWVAGVGPLPDYFQSFHHADLVSTVPLM